MKTALHSFRNQQFKLAIDEPGVARKDKAVLAVMELYEGLGVWTLVDVRLRKYGKAGPWFNVGADQFNAHLYADSVRAAQVACGLLRECRPERSPEDRMVEWCTFDGIVRGKSATEMGVRTHLTNDFATLHTRKEAMEKMRAMAQFWKDTGLSEADPDVREKASLIKIDNPWRQPDEYSMRTMVQQTMGVIETAKAAAMPEAPGFRTP